MPTMAVGEGLPCSALRPWARVPSPTPVAAPAEDALEGRLFRDARATKGPLEFLGSTGTGRFEEEAAKEVEK